MHPLRYLHPSLLLAGIFFLAQRGGDAPRPGAASSSKQDPCEETRYETNTYPGHAETPQLRGVNPAIPAELVKFIGDSLCFKDRGKGDPTLSANWHQLFEEGETVAQFEAQVIPERRAFNVTLKDLSYPRIVAKVVMRRTKNNSTTDVFAPRGYKTGDNYLLLSVVSGSTQLQVVDATGLLTVPTVQGVLTEHGHQLRDRGKLVPPFSDGLSECTRSKDRSACFVDDPRHHTLPTTRSTGHGASGLFVLVRAAENTTATWVKLNGVCYCQGDGCH